MTAKKRTRQPGKLTRNLGKRVQSPALSTVEGVVGPSDTDNRQNNVATLSTFTLRSRGGESLQDLRRVTQRRWRVKSHTLHASCYAPSYVFYLLKEGDLKRPTLFQRGNKEAVAVATPPTSLAPRRPGLSEARPSLFLGGKY